MHLPTLQEIIAQDQRDREVSTHESQGALREFALYAYRNIANDIIDGYGPYLDVLDSQFSFACGEPATLTTWLRTILINASSTADFARRLAVAREMALRTENLQLSSAN